MRFAKYFYSASLISNLEVSSCRRIFCAPVLSNVSLTCITEFVLHTAGLTNTLYVYPTGIPSPLLIKKLVLSLVSTKSYTSWFLLLFVQLFTAAQNQYQRSLLFKRHHISIKKSCPKEQLFFIDSIRKN